MSHVADQAFLGKLPLQHHDDGGHHAWPPEVRLVVYATRVRGKDPYKGWTNEQTEPDTYGPIHGGLVWLAVKGARKRPLWSWVFPGLYESEPSNQDPDLYQSSLLRDDYAVPVAFASQDELPTTNPTSFGTVGKGSEPEEATVWVRSGGLVSQPVALPPTCDGLPEGWPGTVVAATTEDEQQALFSPSGGALVAVHFGPDGKRASLVFDTNEQNRADPSRRARLHRFLRVFKQPQGSPVWFGGTRGLAWQLGPDHDGEAGGGVVADQGDFGGEAPPRESLRQIGSLPAPTAPIVVSPAVDILGVPQPDLLSIMGFGFGRADLNAQRGSVFVGPTQAILATDSALEVADQLAQIKQPPQRGSVGRGVEVLAASSVRYGGPFDVGGSGDQHHLGDNEDGEPANSLHLSTTAIFRAPGGRKDASLEFENEPYLPARDGPIPFRVHLRLDEGAEHAWIGGSKRGRWRWETGGFLYSPEPVRETTGGNSSTTAPPTTFTFPPDTPPPPPDTTEPPPVITRAKTRPRTGARTIVERITGFRPLRTRQPFIPRTIGGDGGFVGGPRETFFPGPGGVPPPPRVTFDPRAGFDPRDLPRDPPTDGPVGLARTCDRTFAASINELATPALLGRPATLNSSLPDLRNRQRVTEAMLLAANDGPVSARLEAYGARTSGDWTKRRGEPCDRYVGGGTDGGFVLTKPQVGLEQILGYAPRGPTDDTRTQLVFYETGLAFGTPRSDGGIQDAWRLQLNPTGPVLEAHRYDSAGADVETVAVAPSGGSTCNCVFGEYGDGFDGDFTFDGGAPGASWGSLSGSTYTLLRDLNGDALTVKAGYTVKTAGYAMRARTSLTIEATAIVSNDGSAGGDGHGNPPGDNAGGAGGTGAPAGSVGGGAAGGAGASSGGGGANGTAGTAATNAVGGDGGAGGNPTGGLGGGTGGAGGSGTFPAASNGSFHTLPAVGTGRNPTGVINGGSGGGGGGSDNNNGATGGGGGGGGGSLTVAAKALTNNGTMRANGGKGGNGGDSGGIVGGGGGGGGGGGVAFVLTASGATYGTLTASGGAGGTKGTASASDGSTGPDGRVIKVIAG